MSEEARHAGVLLFPPQQRFAGNRAMAAVTKNHAPWFASCRLIARDDIGISADEIRTDALSAAGIVLVA